MKQTTKHVGFDAHQATTVAVVGDDTGTCRFKQPLLYLANALVNLAASQLQIAHFDSRLPDRLRRNDEPYSVTLVLRRWEEGTSFAKRAAAAVNSVRNSGRQ